MNQNLRKSPIKHQNSIEIREVMEESISNMLAGVLDFDENEKLEIKSEIKKTCDSKFIDVEKRKNLTMSILYNSCETKPSSIQNSGGSTTSTLPTISLNGQPYGSNQERLNINMDRMDMLNFSPNRNMGEMNITRTEKRSNTMSMPSGYGINIIKSSPMRGNMNEGYSSHPINQSININFEHPENNSTNLFSQNSEFDELLEKNVRIKSKIDNDAHSIMKNNYLKILTTQNGSRVLQKALMNTSKDIIKEIFMEIFEKIPELMVDNYANYFCQKFYSYIDFELKMMFLNSLKRSVVEVGNSKIGTYPLQAVLEQLTTDEEKMVMIDAVKDKTFEMSLVRNII
jgi:hypothetical protein